MRRATPSGREPAGARPPSPRGAYLSPHRRRLTCRLLIDGLNRRERIRLGGRLVVAIALDAGKTERQAAGILRAGLDVVERDLRDDLGA